MILAERRPAAIVSWYLGHPMRWIRYRWWWKPFDVCKICRRSWARGKKNQGCSCHWKLEDDVNLNNTKSRPILHQSSVKSCRVDCFTLVASFGSNMYDIDDMLSPMGGVWRMGIMSLRDSTKDDVLAPNYLRAIACGPHAGALPRSAQAKPPSAWSHPGNLLHDMPSWWSQCEAAQIVPCHNCPWHQKPWSIFDNGSDYGVWEGWNVPRLQDR